MQKVNDARAILQKGKNMYPKIITTSPKAPPRLIIYGEHKIGKSTFASQIPGAIFIQTEDGLDTLNVQAFEKCKSLDDVRSCLQFLMKEPHDFRAVVLDSLDWCEKLIWEDLCKKNGWAQIGDGPYGAGYKLAVNAWRELIKAFEFLNKSRSMMVVLLGHAKITKFEDPERDNYDRYDLDLHDKSGNLLCEYVDVIGFASEKVLVSEKTEGFGKTTKAKSTGKRILNLSKKAAYEAGNRYGLPEQVDFSWPALAEEIKKAFKKAKEKQNEKPRSDDRESARESDSGNAGDSERISLVSNAATSDLSSAKDLHKEGKEKRAALRIEEQGNQDKQ